MATCFNDPTGNRPFDTVCCDFETCATCSCPAGTFTGSCDNNECGTFGSAGALRSCHWGDDDPRFIGSGNDQAGLRGCCSGSVDEKKCKPGFCKNSAQCATFFKNFCQEGNLQTEDCIEFCQTNKGQCDAALRSYCSRPENFSKTVCGCALPLDQYLIASLQTDTGIAVPLTCDVRCGPPTEAIKLAGQQDCQVGAICVISGVDIQALQSQVGAIEIKQNCTSNGGGGNNGGGSGGGVGGFFGSVASFVTSGVGLIILIVAIALIIIVVVLLVRAARARRRQETGRMIEEQEYSRIETRSRR